MHHYELVVVLSPMLNQEQAAETWGRIKEFITNRNGELTHEERWGTRRLAYAIRKGAHNFLEGSYHLTRFSTERPFIRELENFLHVDEQVLRSLLVDTPPPKPAPVVVAEEAPAVAEPEAAVAAATRPVAEATPAAAEAPVPEVAVPVIEETATRSPRRQPGRQEPPEEAAETMAEPEPAAEETATTPRRRQPSRRRAGNEGAESAAEPLAEATTSPTESAVADNAESEQTKA